MNLPAGFLENLFQKVLFDSNEIQHTLLQKINKLYEGNSKNVNVESTIKTKLSYLYKYDEIYIAK